MNKTKIISIFLVFAIFGANLFAKDAKKEKKSTNFSKTMLLW